MIGKVILFILLGISMYLLIEIMSEKETLKKANKYLMKKNEKYYEELLKYYERNKKIKIREKLNYFHKLNILIDKCGLERNIIINPAVLILCGVLCVIIGYNVAFGFFKIVLLSIMISVPLFFLPMVILKAIASYKEEKVEKVFLNFLLQLKNHTKINNDIFYAMKEVKTVEPLQNYVKKFLIETSSGVKFEKAIENFKEKTDVMQIKSFLENLKHCYLYGGSFSKLIEKSYMMIGEIQAEKNKRREETRGARIVLFILILMDILVYISFVKSNEENFMIMKKTILGNMILYWNFISMWILVFISSKVKKLDY